MEKTIRYKFLHRRKSAHGDHTWKKKKWYKVDGEIRMCGNGFHCSNHIQDALSYVQGDTLAIVEVRGKHLSGSDMDVWSEMRVLDTYRFKKDHGVRMAIFSARLCLSAFEKEYPDDKRPCEAIDAAEAWVNNPCDKTRSAAESAESAAWSAARSAGSAAESAARSAGSAAWSAESAAESAESAARSAAGSAARSAGSAAWSAAKSAGSAAWSAESAAGSAGSAESAGSAARSAAKDQIHEHALHTITGETHND